MITIRTTCRLCDARDLSVMLELPPTPIGDRYTETPEPDVEKFPLTLVRCESCKLLQLREVIDPDTLYGHYRYRTADSLGLSDYFDRYVTDVVGGHGKQSGFVVDIGSNDGTLLRAFQKRGYYAIGVDPIGGANTYAVQWDLHAAKSILSGRRQQADIITANNVLANVDDLHDFMEGIRTLLAPDGIFVCETGSGPDLITSRLYDCIYHEHLSYFGLNQLQRLFLQHGLQVTNAIHTDSKGGSLRVTAKLIQDSFLLDDVPPQQREPTHADLAWFASGAKKLKRDVLEALLDLRGRIWVGYGASVGVTTLRYLLELDESIDAFVDDNPQRQRLYTPGLYPREILPSSMLYTRPPKGQSLILFAWRYADVILAKHQAFLAAGGVILQPLPTFTVHTGESYGRRTTAQPDVTGRLPSL